MFNIFKKDDKKSTDTKCDSIICEEGYKNVCDAMNDFGISAKDTIDELTINKILNISRSIIDKENKISNIKLYIDKIMICDRFIVEGYLDNTSEKNRFYIDRFSDDLKSFLTKDYYDKLHKLEDEVKELKNKLIES